MAIKSGAILAVFLSVTAVSGCSVNLKKSVDDYTGTDFSRIRAKNYLPPLTFEVYEKSGQCYKLVDAKNLTAGVNIIGIKSTYNKKLPGMLPPSSEMQGRDAIEYKIKANQHIIITYKEETFRSQYNQVIETRSSSFIPEVGHDYDIYPVNSGVRIVDLTSSTHVPKSWGNEDKECSYKTGLLGGRNYY
ncbi:hypothetical protein BSQ98_23205 [Serratia liquefaciens]|uniref:hypothetical protein n=1 Tax=Serratia liquefaciens TaxID=614 RepID=UPI00065FD2B1|nr:hypothetical protein [Serratia liquefaciens]RYM58616.1 hypothetical protein BSQ98_23205 [Serratia liquefaciens]CAI2459255.1 Uncharacterised protein [Serratia liquefaciens]